jgi:hypothetical protein
MIFSCVFFGFSIGEPILNYILDIQQIISQKYFENFFENFFEKNPKNIWPFQK